MCVCLYNQSAIRLAIVCPSSRKKTLRGLFELFQNLGA